MQWRSFLQKFFIWGDFKKNRSENFRNNIAINDFIKRDFVKGWLNILPLRWWTCWIELFNKKLRYIHSRWPEGLQTMTAGVITFWHYTRFFNITPLRGASLVEEVHEVRMAPSLRFYGSDPTPLLRVPRLYIQYSTCLLHPFNKLSGAVDYMKIERKNKWS